MRHASCSQEFSTAIPSAFRFSRPILIQACEDTCRNDSFLVIEPQGGSPTMPAQGRDAMDKSIFPPPKHWEDWVGFVLSLWLFASPWVLQYRETAAAQNAFVVGFLLFVTEIIALSAFLVWEEWFSAMLGAWLVISPWIFGAALVPAVNFVIVGLLVLALAFYVIRAERRQSAHPA
jgi:hypothetical protein